MYQQYSKRFQLTELPPYGLFTYDFLFALLKKSLVSMYDMNEKNSKVKVTDWTFPESSNGKL